MQKKRLVYFENILVEKRKKLIETIENLREISQVKDSDDIDNDKHAFHIADEGSDSMGREHAFFLISRELKYLQQIDYALETIASGDYGKCTVCGKEISQERLESVPTASMCVSCKNTQAKKSAIT